jgi:hypothetical protein
MRLSDARLLAPPCYGLGIGGASTYEADVISCGYNMSNLVVIAKVGCISRGWEWQIPQNYFGFPVPEDVAVNLSRVAVTSAVGKCLRNLLSRPSSS